MHFTVHYITSVPKTQRICRKTSYFDRIAGIGSPRSLGEAVSSELPHDRPPGIFLYWRRLRNLCRNCLGGKSAQPLAPPLFRTVSLESSAGGALKLPANTGIERKIPAPPDIPNKSGSRDKAGRTGRANKPVNPGMCPGKSEKLRKPRKAGIAEKSAVPGFAEQIRQTEHVTQNRQDNPDKVNGAEPGHAGTRRAENAILLLFSALCCMRRKF